MADVTLVCATHDRAGEVTAFAAFGNDLLLSVAESQVDEYKAAYPHARIDPHPDSIVGLTQKKNHLHEKFGDVFVVDDDVKPMIDHQDSTKVPPEKAVELVQHFGDMAEQMGLFMFGFTSEAIPMRYQPQQPLALKGFLSGGKFGLLEGSGLWWPEDPEYGMCEDVWMSGLNAHTHRALVKSNRYALVTEMGQDGGLSNVRSSESMKKAEDLLVESFGSAIVLKDPNETDAVYHWRLKVPW